MSESPTAKVVAVVILDVPMPTLDNHPDVTTTFELLAT